MSTAATNTTLDISVVVPVFNEAENLLPLVTEISQVLLALERSWELIIVDDGSTDDSQAILAKLLHQRTELRAFRFESRQGQSAALATAFQQARGDVIVTLDGDLQNDPSDIPALLSELEEADLVSGVRARRQDNWSRRLASRVANRVRRWVTRDPVSDVGCSLKAYRAEFLRGLPMFNGMHRFLPALCWQAGARIRELPVNHRPRLHGVSKYGIHNRLWRGLADLIGVRWLLSRWVNSRAAKEIEPWRSSGSSSASLDRSSSLDASSSNGSPPNAPSEASSPSHSGT